MKIGITGSNGFIGWHLRCYIKTLDKVEQIRCTDRTTFSDSTALKKFVKNLDVIVHLAGVNRADENELFTGNSHPAYLLTEALKGNNDGVCIIYASSTYAETQDTAYGKGKAEAGRIFHEWAKNSKGRLVNFFIPHVFGEYGKPFYNSAVATFCHQIVNGEAIKVNKHGQLELIHVQDLVELFIQAYQENWQGNKRITGKKMSVEDVANQLQALHKEYIDHNRFPDLADSFDRSLFNTLRGAIPAPRRIVRPIKHSDERGWLIETVKAGSTGQCFVSTTKPGVTRGNHFHRRKVERFFVLQGKGRIQIRKLFTDKIITYDIDGSQPSYVDMPTLYTHSITNTGTDELITLFWADEFFDPENPDTYFTNV